MSKLAQYWPTVRQVIYGVLATGLAVAAAAGWITPEQSDQWLAHAVTALGALGFIVAGLYVPKAPDVANREQPTPVSVPWDAPAPQRSFPPPDVVADVQRAARDAALRAQMTVDQARAELERRLGR